MDFLCFTLQPTSGARAVTATSGTTTMPGGEGEQLRVHNASASASPVAVFVGLGANAAVFPTDNATPNGKGQVIPVGGVEVFTIPQGADSIYAICPSAGTATIYFGRGKGQ